MGEIIIHDLSLEEADVAASFFNDYWRPNHIFWRSRDLLLWQYHQNPYASQFSNGLTFKVAFGGKAMAGVFAYVPFVFNRYGTRRYGCHLSAWWVKPEYRRGPLGMRLLNELQHRMGFEACISGMNTPVAEKIYETMGWLVVYAIPRLLLLLEPQKLLELIQDFSVDLAIPLYVEDSGAPTEMEVQELLSFRDLHQYGWDDYYWRQFAPTCMGPAREVDYLKWRYEDIPIFRYTGLLALKAGKPNGLLVYRVERIRDTSYDIIRLVDLIADPSAVKALVLAIVEQARRENALMVDFFCTQRRYHKTLAQMGFLDAMETNGARYRYPFLFQPLDFTRLRLDTAWWVKEMDMADSAAHNDFLLMKGDYEFDRPN